MTTYWLVIVDKGERARDIVGRYSSERAALRGLAVWQRLNSDIAYRVVEYRVSTGARRAA